MMWTVHSEMYEGNRWITSTQYQAPMIVHRNEHIYAGDIVVYDNGSSSLCQGKVAQFYVEVNKN